MSLLTFTIEAILAPAILLIAPSAFAQSDSVAVILRPEKVLIQINEAGSSSRLQSFFDALREETDLLLLSDEESVKVDCGRNADAATCVIRLLPSALVVVGENEFNVEVPWDRFPVVPAPTTRSHWMFESSRGDHLEIQITEKGLKISGSKKPRTANL